MTHLFDAFIARRTDCEIAEFTETEIFDLEVDHAIRGDAAQVTFSDHGSRENYRSGNDFVDFRVDVDLGALFE